MGISATLWIFDAEVLQSLQYALGIQGLTCHARHMAMPNSEEKDGEDGWVEVDDEMATEEFEVVTARPYKHGVLLQYSKMYKGHTRRSNSTRFPPDANQPTSLVRQILIPNETNTCSAFFTP